MLRHDMHLTQACFDFLFTPSDSYTLLNTVHTRKHRAGATITVKTDEDLSQIPQKKKQHNFAFYLGKGKILGNRIKTAQKELTVTKEQSTHNAYIRH